MARDRLRWRIPIGFFAQHSPPIPTNEEEKYAMEMTTRSYLRVAVVTALLVAHAGFSQTSTSQHSDEDASSSEPSAAGVITLPPSPVSAPRPYRPLARGGIAWHTGLGGVGFDVATPLAMKFNVRAGFDFFGYSTSFQEQGANIGADLKMRAAHTSLDWFPFGGRFRVSPDFVFANSNQVRATAIIPAGSTVTLDGEDFVSDTSDPLHGSGSVSFRKTAPGLTVGFGDIIPRSKGHISFPIEAGFYYVAQPRLKVAFSGSACDPNSSSSVGCMPVDQDTDFQQSLAAFIARNNHNLSYASFFPVFSFGVGYSF